MDTIGAATEGDIGVGLAVVDAIAGFETVAAFLVHIHPQATQTELCERVHMTALREVEIHVLKDLADASAITQDQLSRVGHIESEP